MILITLGSQKFQFNRLLKEIDELIEKGTIQEKVFAQTGFSDYVPKHYMFRDFMSREEFAESMTKADKVITHGGTGAIISAVKKGKKTIAVPRLAVYGEHVDDHQLQIVEEFGKMNLICECKDLQDLGAKVTALDHMEFETYESNTHTIIRDIEQYIDSL